jgi:ribA/ribD-fused uncharacterized protein
MKMISSFSNEYSWLSNFSPVRIDLQGFSFNSAEAAYQAMKCPERAGEFVGLSAHEAKRLGRRVQLRPDWGEVRLDVMRSILRDKFYDEILRELLLLTGDVELVEGNHWGDTFWGVCNGVGDNWLGKLLMDLRTELLVTVTHPEIPAFWRHDPPIFDTCSVCGNTTRWVYMDVAFMHPRCVVWDAQEGMDGEIEQEVDA